MFLFFKFKVEFFFVIDFGVLINWELFFFLYGVVFKEEYWGCVYCIELFVYCILLYSIFWEFFLFGSVLELKCICLIGRVWFGFVCRNWLLFWKGVECEVKLFFLFFIVFCLVYLIFWVVLDVFVWYGWGLVMLGCW